jgi:hypothetical protein
MSRNGQTIRQRQRLRELAAERRRFDYRRLGWLLAREGHVSRSAPLCLVHRKPAQFITTSRSRSRSSRHSSALSCFCRGASAQRPTSLFGLTIPL